MIADGLRLTTHRGGEKPVTFGRRRGAVRADPWLQLARHEIPQRYLALDALFNFSFRIVSIQNAGMVPNYEAS